MRLPARVAAAGRIAMGGNAHWLARSLAAVWHPCTQIKHHEDGLPLLPVARGAGVWLYDHDGRRYLDGISSWWVNLFGHAHPAINAALTEQLATLEHAMLAGCTHQPVIELSERLARLAPPGLGHANYGSDGASAVEIALKMSFHCWRNRGRERKRRFVSLAGSYHGETLGALSVTDLAIYRDAYAPLLANNLRAPAPVGAAGVGTAPNDLGDPGCPDSAAAAAAALEALFAREHETIAALIVEPLVQGAAGMRMYHPDYLRRARALCERYQVHLIADEIMTGFGRTGTMFACEQAGIAPDLLCLSKGITGGYLPLSVVLATDDIHAAFRDRSHDQSHDDAAARAFLHSHSYTGSALACRAALAVLDLFERDAVLERNRATARALTAAARPLAAHPRVRGFRHRGMIWAFEVADAPADFARRCFAAALERGLLLRPIGDTVYWMPPYVIDDAAIEHLCRATLGALEDSLE